MIKAIRCDRASFKEVRLDRGFNVVLADRTKEATKRDTRNALGKTFLIEIIHFCLGASTKPNKSLRIEELDDWTFMLDITLQEKDFTVYRNTSDVSSIRVEGDFSDWPIKPEYDGKKKEYRIRTREWNLVLGYLLFGLEPRVAAGKYSPSFRSLISYFVRRGIGAFIDPFKHNAQQREWDIQVNNAYLLGLNWEYASEFQVLKDKKKALSSIKEAKTSGLLQEYIGTTGELRANKISLEEKYDVIREQLEAYRVHPEYYALQEEADAITKIMHEYVNKRTINIRILRSYQESLEDEEDISLDLVTQMYERAGFIFGDKALQRIEDVIRFHKQVTENRRSFLRNEIDRLAREIEEQEAEIAKLEEERKKILRALQGKGALDEFVEMQNVATEIKEKIEYLNNRIEQLGYLEEEYSNIKINREELVKSTRRDFLERIDKPERAIKYFNRNSEYLYKEPGTLSVNVEETGYKLSVDIKRAGSQGIEHMKVFCYDLALMQLWSSIGLDKPGFLVHDSTIFDGVDERQVARALELAAAESEKRGFQYICTLNSDNIPYGDFSESFRRRFEESIEVRFTDAMDNGGLFGIRF